MSEADNVKRDRRSRRNSLNITDQLQCARYKSIDINVSISISILLRQSIDIGIGDTFGKYR